MPRRIFNIIEFCIKKNWRQFVGISLVLIIFWSGFFLAWQIQGNKAEVKHVQYVKVAKNIIIILDYWEKEVGKLKEELSKYEIEISRQQNWNRGVE